MVYRIYVEKKKELANENEEIALGVFHTRAVAAKSSKRRFQRRVFNVVKRPGNTAGVEFRKGFGIAPRGTKPRLPQKTA